MSRRPRNSRSATGQNSSSEVDDCVRGLPLRFASVAVGAPGNRGPYRDRSAPPYFFSIRRPAWYNRGIAQRSKAGHKLASAGRSKANASIRPRAGRGAQLETLLQGNTRGERASSVARERPRSSCRVTAGEGADPRATARREVASVAAAREQRWPGGTDAEAKRSSGGPSQDFVVDAGGRADGDRSAARDVSGLRWALVAVAGLTKPRGGRHSGADAADGHELPPRAGLPRGLTSINPLPFRTTMAAGVISSLRRSFGAPVISPCVAVLARAFIPEVIGAARRRARLRSGLVARQNSR